MSPIFYHLTIIATVAVLLVLIGGLLTMLRGNNANLSQRFMRWRVGLQFAAIIVLMIAMFFSR